MSTFVTNGSAKNNATGTTLAATGFNLASAKAVVVWVSYLTTAATVSVSDTAGNTYTPGTLYKKTEHNQWLQSFYCLNSVANASNVITVTWSGGSPDFRSMAYYVYTGPTTWVGEASGEGTSVNTVSTGNLVATGTGVIVAAANLWNSDTFTVGSGFGNFIDNVDQAYEDRGVTAGTYQGVMGVTGNDDLLIAALLLADGAAGPVGTQAQKVGVTGPGVQPGRPLFQFTASPRSTDIVAIPAPPMVGTQGQAVGINGPGVGPFSNNQFRMFPYSTYVVPVQPLNPVIGSYARITPPGPGVGPSRMMQFMSLRLKQGLPADVPNFNPPAIISGGTFDCLTPQPGLMQ